MLNKFLDRLRPTAAPSPPKPTHFQPLDPALEAVPIPDFPTGLQMFYCIGAQKAGTSWLHSYLANAPEVHFSPNKELHYFDVRANRGGMALRVRINSLRILADKLNPKAPGLNLGIVERMADAVDLLQIYTGKGEDADRHDPYLEFLTKGRTNQTLVGDITPSYAILDRVHFADMASIGEAKFIFILRDPVARMWSHFRMSAAADLGPDPTSEMLMGACRKRIHTLVEADRLQAVERADYMRTIAELEAVVPADRIINVIFEDLFKGAATQQICTFLGIEHIDPAIVQPVNEGIPLSIPKDIETLFRHILKEQYNGIRARFGPRVPKGWRL